MWGWTIDRSTRSPINVLVTAGDSRRWTVVAKRPRPDVGAANPGYGDNHGYSHTMYLPVGRHNVCATALNQGSGSNTLLGCRTVVVK